MHKNNKQAKAQAKVTLKAQANMQMGPIQRGYIMKQV